MKSRVGICQKCEQHRWLGGKSRICKPCAYSRGACVQCSKARKIYIDGLCYCCYQHRQVLIQLNQIAADFKDLDQYSSYLFNLYLRYIKRYRLAYFHLKQAESLRKILEGEVFKPIQGWEQIIEASKKYALWHPNKKGNGCAFFKIGYMLQELGVIGPRRDDPAFWIKRSITRFPDPCRGWVQTYVNRLDKLGMTPSTISNHLRIIYAFTSWYETSYPQLNILEATESKCVEYATSLRARCGNLKYQRNHLLGLRRFFAWLKYSGLIASNPCANLSPGRPESKIVVCSDAQLTRLMKFITKANSDPEGAFILSLILFYGATNDELTKAQVGTDNDRLTIIFERPPRSFGRHYYNRPEQLTLPSEPHWFADLQTRFYSFWKDRYERTKKTFPNRRLLLPAHHHSTRPLCDLTVSRRIHRATVAATGIYIPARILRQTCGHLYSQNGDGSLLSRLGWSPQFAFHYTWLPRRITSGHPTPRKMQK